MDNNERDTLIRETHDRITALGPTVNDLKRVVFGNGHKGLVHEVNVISTRQEECPARASAKLGGKLYTVTALALCVSAGSLLWAVFGK